MKPIQKILTTTLWVLMVLAMVSVIGAQWFRGQARRDLPVLAPVPAFDMIDQDGKKVSAADLKGKPWIADFVFTHCAGPCPTMTVQMATMQRTIAAPDLQYISFS